MNMSTFSWREALSVRPLVNRAWSIGLFSERKMSAQDAAFVRMKLKVQERAEAFEANTRATNPGKWRERLAVAKRWRERQRRP